MKSINMRIFEEILEPMFPGEFRWESRCKYYEDVFSTTIKEEGLSKGFNFELETKDAFWLAEKLKVTHLEFKDVRNKYNQHYTKWTCKVGIYSFSDEGNVMEKSVLFYSQGKGDTVSEALGNGMLNIFAKKEEVVCK